MSFNDASPFIPELLFNRRNPVWLESLGSTMVDFRKQLGGKKSFAKLTVVPENSGRL
jgi:hypothetical protein